MNHENLDDEWEYFLIFFLICLYFHSEVRKQSPPMPHGIYTTEHFKDLGQL